MKKREINERSILRRCLSAYIAWILSSVVILLVMCIVASSVPDPDSVIRPLSLCALYLGMIVGGVFASRLIGGGLVGGVLAGLCGAFTVFCVSLLPMYESGFDLGERALLLLLMLPAGAIGAAVGRRKSSSARGKIKKRLGARRR